MVVVHSPWERKGKGGFTPPPHQPSSRPTFGTGCRQDISDFRVPQKECGKRSSITFFVFGAHLVTFRSLFLMFLSLFFRGERIWAIAIRPFYANRSSELHFPIFLGKKRPEFGRKRDLYEPLLTAMGQVLPLLIFFVTFGQTPFAGLLLRQRDDFPLLSDSWVGFGSCSPVAKFHKQVFLQCYPGKKKKATL